MPVVATYWVANLIYSVALKSLFLLDVMFIGFSFVLRVVGGAVINEVAPSAWLILATFFLALFLALGKRRKELLVHESNGQPTRSVLKDYSRWPLDQLLPVVAGLVIIVFSLFAISDYANSRFGSDWLIYTVPFVVYGLFRFIYLLHTESEAEDPMLVLLKDRPMIACIVLWGLVSVLSIYWDRIFELG